MKQLIRISILHCYPIGSLYMKKEYGKNYAKSVDKSRGKNFYTVDAEIEIHNSKPGATYT